MRLRYRYEEFWRKAIEMGCESGVFSVPDERFARMAVLEMCSGVAKWHSPSGEVDLDTIAARHAQSALQLPGTPVRRRGAAALPDAAEVHGLGEDMWQIRLSGPAGHAGDQVARSARSCLIWPPTTVAVTSICLMVLGFTRVGSSERTTKSASMPRASRPFRCSW